MRSRRRWTAMSAAPGDTIEIREMHAKIGEAIAIETWTERCAVSWNEPHRCAVALPSARLVEDDATDRIDRDDARRKVVLAHVVGAPANGAAGARRAEKEVYAALERCGDLAHRLPMRERVV